MARKSRKNLVVFEAPVKAGAKVWKAALYVRLSVEFNGNRGDSLETQRQIMEGYLALCPDIEIAGIYTDNGTTGRTFERKAFQQMLSDIEAGKADCVVVKDLSRLGRNAIDTGYYIEKYFPLHGVRFIAVNDQYDSEQADTGSHLSVPLKNILNEAYAADTSRKVKAQQRQAMRDGEYLGARPPYGYRKAPDNCHKLLINEDTAPVVRQIFQWAADGVPLNAMVKRLNEAGIPTPGYYLASIGLVTNQHLKGSGKWQTWTVAKILRDEVYTGDMVQGKTKITGHKQVPVSKDEWIAVRDTHEPIISRELYAKANAVREQAAQRCSEQAEKVPYTENILRGKIFCGHCGRHLNRKLENKRLYVYHCISNDRIGKGACAHPVRLHETALFDTILTIIRQQAEAIIGNGLRLKQKSRRFAEQKAEMEREIAELQRETEHNRLLLASLFESHVSGMLTRSEYLEMKADYSQKIAEAAGRVQALLAQQSELRRQVQEETCLADRLAEIGGDTALSSLLVNQLIERITVFSSNDISIQFRFESGFGQLMEVLENE